MNIKVLSHVVVQDQIICGKYLQMLSLLLTKLIFFCPRPRIEPGSFPFAIQHVTTQPPSPLGLARQVELGLGLALGSGLTYSDRVGIGLPDVE